MVIANANLSPSLSLKKFHELHHELLCHIMMMQLITELTCAKSNASSWQLAVTAPIIMLSSNLRSTCSCRSGSGRCTRLRTTSARADEIALAQVLTSTTRCGGRTAGQASSPASLDLSTMTTWVPPPGPSQVGCSTRRIPFDVFNDTASSCQNHWSMRAKCCQWQVSLLQHRGTKNLPLGDAACPLATHAAIL